MNAKNTKSRQICNISLFDLAVNRENFGNCLILMVGRQMEILFEVECALAHFYIKKQLVFFE